MSLGAVALVGCGSASTDSNETSDSSDGHDTVDASSKTNVGASGDAAGSDNDEASTTTPQPDASAGTGTGMGADGGDASAPLDLAVQVTVSGLAGSGLTLRNGSATLAVNGNGTFAFAPALPSGTGYSVSVTAEPTNVTQMCSVMNGVGTLGAPNTQPITVVCSTDSFDVGGAISGLSGSVVLQNEGGDDLIVSSSSNDAGTTSFHFDTAVASGAHYAATVETSPAGQTCAVMQGTGSGLVTTSAITSIAVTCTNIPTYTIGGTISGLVGSAILENNSGDDLTVNSNGTFTFATPILDGGAYSVSVKTQPTSPANVTCAVTLAGSSGHVNGANSTGAVVRCTDNAPSTFTTGVDVVTVIKTASQRLPISPLIYGVNGEASDLQGHSAAFLKAISFTRRGGDRGNTYNWETNVSNGGIENGYASDMLLAAGLPNQNAPAGQDLYTLGQNRAASPQRATMVPFVLNDWVAAQVVDYIPYDQSGFARSSYFDRVAGVKGAAYASTPNLTDGMVYTDEHLAYMRAQYTDDIMAPGAGQLIVGIDNEPDLWDYNFPMLQMGSGDNLYSTNNGAYIGNKVTPAEFEQRVIAFATKVKTLSPNAYVVGPSHYGYDGFRGWNTAGTGNWPDDGTWFMDDFLAVMNTASATAGMRLLDTWDFHWYPQATYNGVTVSALDNNSSALTSDEIQAIVQGPRSYWDTTYDEGSWITSQYHLNGPAYIVTRLQSKIAAAYPGTSLGVSEYFPGGLNHISSGIATADTLGVFQRMGIVLAAMWPNGSDSDCRFAFGGIELLRNADGSGLSYASTNVEVDHPEIAPSSVYAGMDTPDTVTVLVVNKTTSARTFGLEMYNGDELGKVSIYTLDANHATPYLAKSDTLTMNNAYAFASGAMSASMLIFKTTP